jgi:hypothetical protein
VGLRVEWPDVVRLPESVQGSNTQMKPDIHVAAFRNGDHICLFYRDVEEQLSTAVPFVQLGLLRGECCLCVLPDDRMGSFMSYLRGAGVDTEKEIARGALLTAKPEDSYLSGGSFDRGQMVSFLDSHMHEALRAGFTGFRGTGDLSWAVKDTNTCGHVSEYEAMLDSYYPGKPALGICMYDANLLDEAQLNRIIAAHRLALTVPSTNKRAIRIRNGVTFGDVIFDRASAHLFHYTVQKTGRNELFSVGQEETLTAAMDAVEAALLSLQRATC